MANSAFDHTAAITLPGSSTNTGIVTWSGTGANTLLDSTVLVSGNNITIPGTITLGGTAITSTAAEINLLDALDRGSILYGNASGATAVLGQGSNGQVLTSDGTDISWENASAGATLSGSTDNTVVTVTGANAMAGEANLTFDGTKLGINTAAPDSGQYLHIVGANGSISGLTATTTSQMTVENNSNAAISILSPAADFGAIYFGDADSNIAGGLIYNHGATRFDFRVEGSTKFIMEADDLTISDGNLVIGTAGHGIDFSAQSSPASGMTSELLDRYEEGTFTPAIADATLNGTSEGQTYHSSTIGRYTRIGRQVHVYGHVNITSSGTMTSTDGVNIVGFPFTALAIGSLNASFHFGSLNNGNISQYAHISGFVAAGTSYVQMKEWNTAAGVSSFQIQELSSSANFNFSGTYYI